jgi:peptide/nickel transport system permease protein
VTAPTETAVSRPARFGLGRVGRAGGFATTFCLIIVTVIGLMVVFGGVIAPYDPNAVDLNAALQGPTAAHPFGTDATGRDVLSRVLVGARPSVLGPLLIALFATGLGTLIGVASAWRGGWSDSVMSRSMDMAFAFPGLLVAMIAVAIIGRGLTAPVVALIIANIPWVARIVRSAALRERSLPYVASYTIEGFSGATICLRHILPNVFRTVSAQAALTFTYAMIDLLAINFLGLGVQPPTSDWGVLVSDGHDAILQGAPWQTVFASVFIVLTVVAVTVLSERLGEQAAYTVERPA